MQLKKIQTRIFCGQKPKVFIKIKYPEQVAEPESCVTVRIFLFGAVSSKKRYLPTAPSSALVFMCFYSIVISTDALAYIILEHEEKNTMTFLSD